MSVEFACVVSRHLLQTVNDVELRTKLEEVTRLYEDECPLRAKSAFDLLEREFAFKSADLFDIFSLIKNFLFKRPDRRTSKSAQSKAISDFLAAEGKCRDLVINRRDPRVIRAREIIFRTLGEFDDYAYREILRRSRPGGGQSIGLWNRFRSSPIHKYVACDYTVTPSAAQFARDLLNEVGFPFDSTRPLIPVKGVKLAFVPKNISTFRTVAVEPNLNMFLQLGVHEYLVPRLLRVGVNLQDQSVNQELSRVGSIDGSLATVDFSQASDLLSDELVFSLLPRSWYNFLSRLRCKEYYHDGKWKQQHKFSTMGNGFTFALESLIFYALARSVSDGTIGVFGDDVVLPASAYVPFSELVEEVGLVLNQDKSFHSGPFRESCGAYWWSGESIAPLRLQDEQVTVFSLHRLYNNWALRPASGPIKNYILSYYKRNFGKLLFGLENEDDTSCFFTSFEYAQGARLLKWNSNWQTWTFKGLTQKGIQDTSAPVDWLYTHALLYGAKDSEVRFTLKDCSKAVLIKLTPGVHLKTHAWRVATFEG